MHKILVMNGKLIARFYIIKVHGALPHLLLMFPEDLKPVGLRAQGSGAVVLPGPSRGRGARGPP